MKTKIILKHFDTICYYFGKKRILRWFTYKFAQ